VLNKEGEIVNILVAYYSRSGLTKNLAENIAKALEADIDEIIDEKKRSGFIGALKAGKDAFFEKKTNITYDKNPDSYDLVVVGTPVWAGRITPALRTYLSENSFEKIAFFATHGGGQGKVFENMESLSDKPLDTLGVKMKNAKLTTIHQKVEKFCDKIKEKT